MSKPMVDIMSPRCVGAFMALVALGSALVLGLRLFVIPNPWVILEWGTNYEAGFVRRGLSGEILLGVEALTGMSVVSQIFVLGLGLYGLFLLSVYLLLRAASFPRGAVLLVYSPFFLIYQISSWSSTGRKDIVFLALLAAICALRFGSTARAARLTSNGLVLLLPLVVLMHEGLALFFGWVAAAVLLSRPDRRDLACLALAAGLSAAAFGMSLGAGGIVQADVLAICGALEGALGDADMQLACPSADNPILWLARDAATGMAEVRYNLPFLLPSLPPALLLVGLAFVPLTPGLRALESADRRRFVALAAMSVLATLPVFVVAIDWGRFIYLNAAAAGLVVLGLFTTVEREPLRGRKLPVLLVACYFLGWSLHYKETLVGGGLIVDYLAKVLFDLG